MQLSVVIPCLNEHETIGAVVTKALRGLASSGVQGEVIVADNGSTDGSREIAAELGARVIAVEQKGYGNALQGGIAAAQGDWIIMGDADDSYDFLEIPKFVEAMKQDLDLVMGCRLPTGGGTVAPEAMPWSHRWIGNPGFSFLARLLFGYQGHDVYCGLRAFKRELPQRLHLKSPGMEFAVEMVLKSAVFKASFGEVPITLHKDGRKLAKPHLRTVRDGWRTLRLFLAFSPKSLFLLPALVLLLAGVAGYALALPNVSIGAATFDVHTLLVASLALIVAQQLAVFAVVGQIAAVGQGLAPSGLADKILDWLPLERVLAFSVLLICLGVGWIVALAMGWRAVDFGPLDYRATMKALIPAVTLVALSVQLFSSSFFLSAMRSWRDLA
jgi:glycosyltransferase involved in cell wall biosynthesis